MSEDVSAMIRIAVTVIIVSSLVAAVLNLLVVGRSTMSTGMSNLQAGVNQITLQEFAPYNQKTVYGTEVSSAITLYSGRDIAMLVATNTCINDSTGAAEKFYNYGALIDGNSAAGATSMSETPTVTCSTTAATTGLYRANDGDSYWTAEYEYDTTNSSMIKTYGNIKNTTMSGAEYILPSGKFYSELVKNSTGEIIGIAFTQRK
jgi:hypothetical protein